MAYRYKTVKIAGKTKLLHRHIMELHIGRALAVDEQVHHKNGNRYDNRIENLEVMSCKDHMHEHKQKHPEEKIMDILPKGGGLLGATARLLITQFDEAEKREEAQPAKKVSKAEIAMGEVIQALLDNGFDPDGHTQEQIVRVPTRKSPLFGKSGGELAKFGGRQRFVKTGTNIKATVGARTTALYRIEGKGLEGVSGIASLNTKDIEGLRGALAAL